MSASSIRDADVVLDKAVGGVGFVEDHQSAVEFLHTKDTDYGLGRLGHNSEKVAL